MKQLLFSLVGFSLLGCTLATPRNEPPVIDLTPRCGASELRGLIGQDAAVLREVSLPQNTRVVRPGMALTQDYSPNRLNISIDEGEVIDRVWCS